MKEYRVYEDKYSSGYIAKLKDKQKYAEYMKVVLKPGGIRPKKIVDDYHLPQRAESIYSDKGSRKKIKFLIP